MKFSTLTCSFQRILWSVWQACSANSFAMVVRRALNRFLRPNGCAGEWTAARCRCIRLMQFDRCPGTRRCVDAGVLEQGTEIVHDQFRNNNVIRVETNTRMAFKLERCPGPNNGVSVFAHYNSI